MQRQDRDGISHRVSVQLAGDSSSLISRVWFSLPGKPEITVIPQGQAFDVHCSVNVTKQYVKDNYTSGYWDVGGWGINVFAISAAFPKMGKWAFKTTWGDYISVADFIPDKAYSNWGNFVMGTSDITIVILLLATLTEGDAITGISTEDLNQFIT